MRVPATLATLVVVGLLAPSPAATAADDPWAGVTWSAPEGVSPAGIDVAAGGVWPLADGSLLALWSVVDDPTAGGDGPAQVWSSSRGPGSEVWTPPVAVSDFQQYFTAYPNFVWDVDPSGAAVVAWTQYDDAADVWTYRAVVRTAAGTWGAPTTVAAGGTDGLGPISLAGRKAVAVAPDGGATVAFEAREPAASPGETSADREVFRTHWSGTAWTAPEEVSVETPPFPIVCAEPDPDDCPDREGHSDQPAVAFDGWGREWIAWVHTEAADEPAEEAGIFVRGAVTSHLATGSEQDPRTFALAGIDADPAGGIALAWTREVASGRETWAHAGGDVTGATSLITPASVNGSVRSIAMAHGQAMVVVATGTAGVDGSRDLLTSHRAATGAWASPAPMVEGSSAVRGVGGRALITPAGVPVVGHTDGGDGAVLAPTTSGWARTEVDGVLGSLQVAASGVLYAGSRVVDGGVHRLRVSVSSAGPATVTPPSPPPGPAPPPGPTPGPTPSPLVVVDDGALGRSSGWQRKTGAAYDGGTALLAKRKGAVLTLPRTPLTQVGVLATTCSRCGKVEVFVGKRRVGRISLKGASAHQQTRLLPAFAARSGKVRLVVVTRGRAVRIDALVIRAG
ncbi:hypothetical protein [Nocardioides sp. SLBN-35]|uniref:hypothetical protein n=1 Tax=Nocardioides sp. SLBN-35 TaxID=2768445 RepID=UPI00115268A4|nr:hypothetical protein [Nocardioides sp. SLBN-35]TQK69030.1 hypothetical protein FBY23_0790 [Nocardioides sp. SLBN-35]